MGRSGERSHSSTYAYASIWLTRPFTCDGPSDRRERGPTSGGIACWTAPRNLLFDHPIRSQPHGLRDRETDLAGGLEVDHQLQPRQLLDRQIPRPHAFKDLVYVRRRSPIAFSEARGISKQNALRNARRDEAGERN